MEPTPAENETVTGQGVLEKYTAAGQIARTVIREVAERCVEGASIYELCRIGDQRIVEESKKTFKNKKFERGIAFPTCISVNEICGHFSPLKDDEVAPLATGDIAKIDLGVQFDGYMVMLAHTVVVGGDKVTGPKADAVRAAYDCMQAAVRLLKPGNHNGQITDAIAKVCDAYEVSPVEGVLSHELQRYMIDGNNVIINKESEEQRVADVEFQVNQIYAIDCIVSTGDGKPKQAEDRITVFKRNLDANFDLKTRYGRQFFSTLNKEFPSLAFSLSAFDDEIMARAGSNECVKNNLLEPYHVLKETAGEVVAHFKWTVLISNKRINLLAHNLLDTAQFETDKKVEDAELAELLKIDLDEISKKKRKQKKKATA